MNELSNYNELSFQDIVAKMIADRDNFIVVVFFAPRSPRWSFLKSLCKQADFYVEREKNVAISFKNERNSIDIYNSIYSVCWDWKSVTIYFNKKPVSNISNVRWMHCYLESLKCSSKEAWCVSAITGPYKGETRDIVFGVTIDIDMLNETETVKGGKETQRHICPCKSLATWCYNWKYIEYSMSVRDSFEAFAVEYGYFDCPNFDMSIFKTIDGIYDIKK